MVASATTVRTTPLCPEIRLRLADDMDALWRGIEEQLGATGMPPPYWAVAWPGGQALARYLLDNPATVSGVRVLDLGSGCGIAALAAARANAAHVDAADCDPFAIEALEGNARLNALAVQPIAGDVIGGEARWDVVLAGDLWYERFLAQRVSSWLRALNADGCRVLLGDPGRAYFPRGSGRRLATYRATGPHGAVDAGVWELGRAAR